MSAQAEVRLTEPQTDLAQITDAVLDIFHKLPHEFRISRFGPIRDLSESGIGPTKPWSQSTIDAQFALRDKLMVNLQQSGSLDLVEVRLVASHITQALFDGLDGHQTIWVGHGVQQTPADGEYLTELHKHLQEVELIPRLLTDADSYLPWAAYRPIPRTPLFIRNIAIASTRQVHYDHYYSLVGASHVPSARFPS